MEENCCVCYRPTSTILPRCGHFIDFICLKRWLQPDMNRTCPLCRAPIIEAIHMNDWEALSISKFMQADEQFAKFPRRLRQWMQSEHRNMYPASPVYNEHYHSTVPTLSLMDILEIFYYKRAKGKNRVMCSYLKGALKKFHTCSDQCPENFCLLICMYNS